MTVSTNNRRAGPYAGNGVATNFAFTFRMFSADDLVATVADADGVETVLDNGVDYTGTLNADQSATPGGSITLATALASGKTLVITSAVEASQGTNLTNAGGFYPDVIETALDRAVVLVQQLQALINRAMIIPVTNATVTDLTVPVNPGAVLQWSGDGGKLLALDLPDLSLSLALPDQTGKANMPLFSNGTTSLWRTIQVGDVAGLSASLANFGTYINYCTATAQNHELRLNTMTADVQAKANFALNAAVIF